MSKEIICKQYEKINGQDLRIELYYDLGGRNYYSGKNKERGYYVSVQPIKLTDMGGYTMEEYAPMQGVYKLVHPVKRKSKKAETIAESLLDEVKNELIEYVLNKAA